MRKNSENPNLVENVVVLEGVGSLGAFGCGVLKAVAQHNIKIDIIAGTSNGGINAAIFAGSKDVQHPERSLEEFWLDIAGNSASLRERFKERRVQQQAPFPISIGLMPERSSLLSQHLLHQFLRVGQKICLGGDLFTLQMV